MNRAQGVARARAPIAVVAPEKMRKKPLDSATDARSRAQSERVVERLWRAYRRRPDDESRNRLVEHYQPLIAELVRRLAARLPRSVDRGDLATAANVGLMAAVGGFDPTRGVRFENYCELRVRGALLDELRSHDWLSRPWRARLELQKRVLERLRSRTDREPLDEDVAAEMGMPLVAYRHVFGLGLLDAPLVSVTDPDGDGSQVLDVVPDPNADSAGEKLSRDEILRLVAQKLTGQEYRLVYLKYWEELSMREIGQMMRISESRVCKIHMRLLERLKDRFRVGAED
ncbi:MAG: sigma-70 family RNA polymerase sigma factor [Planctomycetes bacterium]|nr:sigma-70 family RNA polymerase sigma factor [Planctomycetota bacterium]